MIIEIESLDKMYQENNKSAHFCYQGACHNCGCHVDVVITKTSGGYGLNGGMLYETPPQNFMIICDNCHEKWEKDV